MMVIDNKFDIGQTVYLSTDSDQKKRLVTGLSVGKDLIQYELCCGVEKTWHYDFEISINKDVLITSEN